jgi:uncharacterized protein (TIGR02246 family)
MDSQTATRTAADEDAIYAIHRRMIDAWNAGDGAAFASPFTDDADFVAFEGTHLKGRQEISLFHQRIFNTVVKESRLEGEVKFVRLLDHVLGVSHSMIGLDRDRAAGRHCPATHPSTMAPDTVSERPRCPRRAARRPGDLPLPCHQARHRPVHIAHGVSRPACRCHALVRGLEAGAQRALSGLCPARLHIMPGA